MTASEMARLRWQHTSPSERLAFLRRIGRKGGRKRRRMLPAARRRQIAEYAAWCRWKDKPADPTLQDDAGTIRDGPADP